MHLALPTLGNQVVKASREVEDVDGDEDALLYNMTATLGSMCAFLCVMSTCGMAAHSTYIMAQAMVFQAISAPGLVLCGVLLYSSTAGLATGMHARRKRYVQAWREQHVGR